MAFFKFRKGGDEQPAATAQPESVETLRRRAKNRLIGAVVLVLVGVVGFPLLVDKQPRPVALDLPIEIPDKNKTLPLTAPALGVMPEATMPKATPGFITGSPAAVDRPEQTATEKIVSSEAMGASSTALPPTVEGKLAETKPQLETKPQAKPEQKPAAVVLSETKAKSDTKSDAQPAGDSRFVVQVGSFSDEAHAREARQKLERAGLKNYIQTIESKEGRRIRVRAGPFDSKAEAERAAEKCKKLNLPTAVLSL